MFTADGGVYSLAVSYDPEPSVWVYTLPALKGSSVQKTARGLQFHPSEEGWTNARRVGFSARVKGIYGRDNVLYFSLTIEFSTTMGFVIESPRFFIRGKREAARSGN